MQIRIDGYEELQKKLASVFAFLRNPKVAMAQSSVKMQQNVLRHFNDAKASTGTWASPKYRKGRPLQDTGRLKKSIDKSSTSTYAKVGTNLKYAAIHNFGGEIRPKSGRFLVFPIGKKKVFARKVTIPQREFMWLSDDAKTQIVDVFNKQLGAL